MSRVRRASIGALFAYVNTLLPMIVGLAMVPFVLGQVGLATYSLWLVSGEVLGYAAMADLGVLNILPWLIAEADGRGDRAAIRRLLSNAFFAAVLMALAYVAVVAGLWQLAPALLEITAEQRRTIAGPLTLMAAVTCVVLPLRVTWAILHGLQDVPFSGTVATVSWIADVTIAVTLLINGYGLWALAAGSSARGIVTAGCSIFRAGRIAPDLLRDWPRPTREAISRLFREGLGGWIGGWGWRLSSATDGIVLTALGQLPNVTRLATTARLAQTLMQLSWVPGDNGLVGLAQLSGDAGRTRVRQAVAALLRLHLTLASAAVCVVLIVNAPFVTWWLPEGIFGGRLLTAAIALNVVFMTGSHALSTVISVLGHRMRVGIVTAAAGVVQVAAAYLLAKRFGIAGIPLGAMLAQAFVLYPLLTLPLATVSGLEPRMLLRDVVGRWAVRTVPAFLAAAAAGIALWTMPLVLAAALAGAAALIYLWVSRRLVLDYPPIVEVLRRPLARLHLERLLPPQAEPADR